MKRVNEIFYSLQGEGYNTGRPAVFVRFCGCNLRCAFCDTDFAQGDMMSDEAIVEAVKQYPSRLLVFTGGEPSLTLDTHLIDLLHAEGFTIAVETNGTHALPQNVDHITCSPKFEYNPNAEVVLPHMDELKVVWTGHNDMSLYQHLQATRRYLQPCDVQDAARNREIQQSAIQYCLDHPEWTLSLQTHKILNVR